MIVRDLRLAARVGGSRRARAGVLPDAGHAGARSRSGRTSRCWPGSARRSCGWPRCSSTLIGLDRLFQADEEDGSLDLLCAAPAPLELVVLAKAIAHWLTTGLPLALAAPLFGLLVALTPTGMLAVTATLIVGTPALTFIGAVGAALTASIRRGGLILAILVLPLMIPSLMFGVSAADAAGGGRCRSRRPSSCWPRCRWRPARSARSAPRPRCASRTDVRARRPTMRPRRAPPRRPARRRRPSAAAPGRRGGPRRCCRPARGTARPRARRRARAGGLATTPARSVVATARTQVRTSELSSRPLDSATASTRQTSVGRKPTRTMTRYGHHGPSIVPALTRRAPNARPGRPRCRRRGRA